LVAEQLAQPAPQAVSEGSVVSTVLAIATQIEVLKRQYAEQTALYDEQLPQMQSLQDKLANNLYPRVQPLEDEYARLHQMVLNCQAGINLYNSRVATLNRMVEYCSGHVALFPPFFSPDQAFPDWALVDEQRDWRGVPIFILTQGELEGRRNTYVSLAAGQTGRLAQLQADETNFAGQGSEYANLKAEIVAAESNYTTYKIAVDTALTIASRTQKQINDLEAQMKLQTGTQVTP
jgi:chromosome segregation ATPase